MRLVVLVSILSAALVGCEGRKKARPAQPAPRAIDLPALRATDGATEWKITDKNLILRVQGRLQDLGIYLGPVDGSYRKDVETALAQFQAARGLVATGVIDADTADALGLPAHVMKAPAATPGATPPKGLPDAGVTAPEASRAPLPPPRTLPSVAAAPGRKAIDVAPPAGQAPAGMLPADRAPEPPPPEAYSSPPSAAVPLEAAPGSAAAPAWTPKPGI